MGAVVVGCIGVEIMRDADLVFAWLVLGRVLCSAEEVRRAEMFARTLFTGLRDEEDVVEEVVKLDSEDARTLSGFLDTELSYAWRGLVVVRIDPDLAECCMSIVVCVVA
jgi:hypothetical protein